VYILLLHLISGRLSLSLDVAIPVYFYLFLRGRWSLTYCDYLRQNSMHIAMRVANVFALK
jgi:hypothetical protein